MELRHGEHCCWCMLLGLTIVNTVSQVYYCDVSLVEFKDSWIGAIGSGSDWWHFCSPLNVTLV